MRSPRPGSWLRHSCVTSSRLCASLGPKGEKEEAGILLSPQQAKGRGGAQFSFSFFFFFIFSTKSLNENQLQRQRILL